MATYNWTYKNGFNNPYNLTVPSTTDDATRPTSWAYVAPWGNDTSGNGSRQLPYRTISKAQSIAGATSNIVLAPGTYREAQAVTGAIVLIGDGAVIIDVTLIRANVFINSAGGCYNITFRGGSNIISAGSGPFLDCIFQMPVVATLNLANSFQRCTFVNSEVRLTSPSLNAWSNNTFYRSNVLFTGAPVAQSTTSSIFVECNVSFGASANHIDYCLFWHCNFRFNATLLSGGTTFYPSVPSGYTSISDIATLRTTNTTAFGAATQNFNNCSIADPLFNNAAINDFTLQPTSLTKNRSYFGNYIGAYSIASKIGVKANAATSDFDNSTAVNLTIADDSLTLTSTSAVASIEAKPIANLSGRQITRFSALALNADRNGEFITTTANLSASTLSPGAVPVNTPYLVEVGSIVYNGVTYLAGDKFTSATTSLSFTTSTGGVIREILQAPSRQVVEARFNAGTATTIDNTGTIATGTWYYVESGSATYASNTYAAGSFLKGVGGSASFTGTGILRPVFASSDTWYLFELGIAPTTNNTGNVRTGSVVKGNGSDTFDRTPANVFAVNSKFIQLKYTIQVANLIP